VKPGLPVADLTRACGWRSASSRCSPGAKRPATARISIFDARRPGEPADARRRALSSRWARCRRASAPSIRARALGHFRCKDGKFAHITASDQHWEPLCRVLNLKFDIDLSTNEVAWSIATSVMQKLTKKSQA
jgi:crotonobetainyl-CoA:carnitine CoA-transferase CaiB-like acyl-CoA transferase